VFYGVAINQRICSIVKNVHSFEDAKKLYAVNTILLRIK